MRWIFCLVLLAACSDGAVGAGSADSGGVPADSGTSQDGGGGDALGSSLSVVVQSPEDGVIFKVGEPIPLAGVVSGDGALPAVDVSWSSSLDGVVWQGHPQANGSVTASADGLRAGLHDLTLKAMRGGKSASATVKVRVNTVPTTATVVIDPGTPTTADDLVVLITEPATDADVTDMLGYSYVWSRDGVVVPEAVTKTASHTLTSRGQVWEVKVVASDGWHPGGAATASVTIANSAPGVGGALVLPSSGTTDSVLTCSASGAKDADGDPVDLRFEWFVNGEKAGEGPTLSGDALTKGATVVCRVTPTDGIDEGAAVESAPVPILNSAPVVGAVTLTPGSGTSTTAFACAWEGLADADGDPVTAQVAWVLDGQELVGTAAGTLVPVSVGAHKGQALKCRVRPSDGQGNGAPMDSNAVLLDNALPVVASVVVKGGVGGSAKEGDELTCEAAAPVDEDGDTVGIVWGWIVDGEPVVVGGSPVQTATLGGANFDKGQLVQCTATPHDGEDAGVTVTSKNAVSVVNTAPSLAGVELQPKTASRGTELACVVTGFADPDPADAPAAWGTLDPMDTTTPGTAIQWLSNGAPIGGAVGVTFVPSSLAPGDSVSCRATPHDGQEAGASVTSNAVVIQNLKPSISGVALGPSPAFGDTVLTCAPSGWSDGDGDQEGYTWAWTKNGVPLAGATGSTLDGSHFDKGDVLLCTATPFDGWDQGGSVASDQVTIQNQPPSLGAAILSPASGGKTTQFTCEPSGLSDADASDPVYYSYAWKTADGQPLGLSGAKVSGAAVPLGTSFVCVVTPFDGEAYGEPVTSNQAKIVNNPPTLAAAVIAPTAPGVADALTCTAVGFSDPDGDEPVLTYEWFVNAVVLAGQASPILAAGTVSKGEKVFCRITPGDGAATGSPKTSQEVAIGNAAPSAPVVQISPQAPDAGQSLTCMVVGGAEDPDGDPVSVDFAWLLDGALVAGQTGPSLDGALTTQCGQWTCSAVASDGDGGQSEPGTDTVSLLSGTGVVFGGATHQVLVAAAPTLVFPGGAMTVEAWVRRTGDSGVIAERMVGGKGFRLSLSGGAPVAVVGDGPNSWSVTATDGLPAGLYTHVAMTYDGGNLRLFVGGQKQPDEVMTVGVAFEGGGSLVLGNDGAQTSPFAGTLDEVRVSSTARYAASFAPKVSFSPDLSTLAYFRFEADKATIAYDASGKANDGVIVGASHGVGVCNPANSAPTPPVVEIKPLIPTVSDSLTCSIKSPGVDPDGDPVSYVYSWQKDGVPTAQTGATVPASATAACEVWSCFAKATDGELESAAATASVEVQDVGATTWYGYNPSGSQSSFNQLAEQEEVAIVFPKVVGPVTVKKIYVKMDATKPGVQAYVYAVGTATENAAALWTGNVAQGTVAFQELVVNGGAGVVIPDGKALRVGVRCAAYLGLAAYHTATGFGTSILKACGAYWPGAGCLTSYSWVSSSQYGAGYWTIHAEIETAGGGICQ